MPCVYAWEAFIYVARAVGTTGTENIRVADPNTTLSQSRLRCLLSGLEEADLSRILHPDRDRALKSTNITCWR
jgi:hypothetical protein